MATRSNTMPASPPMAPGTEIAQALQDARDAFSDISKDGFGLQGIIEDHGHDANALNYHSMVYWQKVAARRKATARDARGRLDAVLAGAGETVARPLDEWHEDHGFVVWWCWDDGRWLGEPAWIGSPNCSDWPEYHTHWTPHPLFPAKVQP